jgi:hypothetical protein
MVSGGFPLNSRTGYYHRGYCKYGRTTGYLYGGDQPTKIWLKQIPYGCDGLAGSIEIHPSGASLLSDCKQPGTTLNWTKLVSASIFLGKKEERVTTVVVPKRNVVLLLTGDRVSSA